MTEHNRDDAQPGHAQGMGGRFGSGQQAHGGYGQGSYGYGQGGAGGEQPQDEGRYGTSGNPQGLTGGGSNQAPGERDASGAQSGTQRSDERLREMICERLMEEHSIDASDVEISVQGGRVTLEGSIDSRMAKYQIEDIVDHMGVNDVQNNLCVGRDKQQVPREGAERASGPSSQAGSSGGVSSLGMSGSGTAGVDRTSTGGASSGGSKPSSSPQ